MGEKGYGGATTAAQRAERIDFALRTIADRGKYNGTAKAVAQEFKCGSDSARRCARAAKRLMAVDMPTVVTASRAHLRMLLAAMIRKSQDPKTVLAAIKQMRELLGLDAPARSEVAMTGEAFDPLAAYANNPDLMERALELEREIYAADKAVAAVNTGEARVPGAGTVAVPSALGDTGSSDNEAADRSELQQAGREDAGSPR